MLDLFSCSACAALVLLLCAFLSAVVGPRTVEGNSFQRSSPSASCKTSALGSRSAIAETYPVRQWVKCVRVQRIRYRHCPVRHRHVDVLGLHARGHGPFFIWWNRGPVPVWQPQRRKSLVVAVFQLSIWQCRHSLTTVQIHYFLKQRQVGSVPRGEDVAVMTAVTRVATPVVIVAFHSIPRYKWTAVNSYMCKSVNVRLLGYRPWLNVVNGSTR